MTCASSTGELRSPGRAEARPTTASMGLGWGGVQPAARRSPLAFRAAGNLACRRPFRPPFPIRDEFLRLRCGMPAKHEAGEMPANWVSGVFEGGLKGRLQARLPATQ